MIGGIYVEATQIKYTPGCVYRKEGAVADVRLANHRLKFRPITGQLHLNWYFNFLN